MRRTIRLISTLAALGCSATAAIAAEDYVDRENHFRVSIPAGWDRHANVADKIDLVLLSPRIERTEGMCILMGEPVQEAEKLTQEQINQGMGEFDDAFWRSIVEAKDTTDIKVEVSNEMRSDRKVALATVHYTVTTDGKPVPSVDYYILQIVPGVILMGQCGLPVAHVDEERADIKVVLESFAPSGGSGIISKLTPPRNEARLTLYAGPRFDGVTRELTGDMPNLGQSGWSVSTGSFNVKGYGVWEICDGVNYQGNCQVVAGASSAALGDRALRIGSARRVTAADPRNAVGLAAEAVIAARAERAKQRHR